MQNSLPSSAVILMAVWSSQPNAGRKGDESEKKTQKYEQYTPYSMSDRCDIYTG